MKQYAASPIINQLIDYRKSYFSKDWANSFYDVVWNIDTAQGIGLDIWGRIVCAERKISVTDSDFFGFSTAPTKSWKPFNQGVFYSGEKHSGVFSLSDNAYRTLILAKALTNISATDIKSINKALRSLFPGRGNAYVRESGTMSLDYIFDFFLEPWELSVVKFGNVIPKPAGVSVSVFDASDDFLAFELECNILHSYSNIKLPSDLKIN